MEGTTKKTDDPSQLRFNWAHMPHANSNPQPQCWQASHTVVQQLRPDSATAAHNQQNNFSV